MAEVEVLCDNEWLSLKKIVDKPRGINGYVFSHEARCQGKIVAVLPFKRLSKQRLSYMARVEVTPCWKLSESISALTGGYEGGQLIDDAIRELDEEAGYTATANEMIALGTCYGVKSTDTVYYLYAVDVTDKTPHKARGDGSVLEDKASMTELFDKDLWGVDDPLVYAMIQRLKIYIES